MVAEAGMGGGALGCSIEEFADADTQIPPLARYLDELMGFGAACRAAADAQRKAKRNRGAGTALRRQAAQDADLLLLAEWWNELLDQHDVLIELLFRARAELRASRPSHSVLRAQVNRAAQKYLSIAQQATAAAHAKLMAAQQQTDGARMAVLEQVLDAAVADSNISCTMRPLTSFGAFDPDWRRDSHAERLDETTPSVTDEQARAYASNADQHSCHPDVDSDLESAQRLASVPEPRDVAQIGCHGTAAAPAAADEEIEAINTPFPASIEHEHCWVPKADMNSLPKHTTLDLQERIVPTITACDMQANPPTFTTHAAPAIDEAGTVFPSVRGKPIAYLEELAEPPRQGRHTDRLALRRCQDEYWGRESDNDGGGSSDNEVAEEHASWRAREGDRLTIPAWARATLLDC